MTTFPRNYQTESRTVICVVRWFVLGNCFNYGSAPFFFSVVPPIPSPILPPQLAGIWIFNQPDFLDDPKYRVDPDGQVCHFEDHFTQMLKEFQKAQMQVIPSIIDFHALLDPFPGERAPGLKNRARGRGDIAEDKKKRDLFLNKVLKRFVDLAVPFKDTVFAIEVINEPIWNVRTEKPAPPFIGNRVIPDKVMIEFLNQACDIIEDAGLDSTVGHRFFEDCLKFPSGTIAQFHYYPHQATIPLTGLLAILFNPKIDLNADPGVIPDHAKALSDIVAAQATIRPNGRKKVKDVFVGEFGSRLVGEFSDNHGHEWPELNGKDTTAREIVFQRLSLLSSKKYNLALVWPDLPLEFADLIINFANPANSRKMSLGKIISLCRYTGGVFP